MQLKINESGKCLLRAKQSSKTFVELAIILLVTFGRHKQASVEIFCDSIYQQSPIIIEYLESVSYAVRNIDVKNYNSHCFKHESKKILHFLCHKEARNLEDIYLLNLRRSISKIRQLAVIGQPIYL